MNDEENKNVDTESTNAAEEVKQETPAEKTYTQADIDDMKAKWEGNFQEKLDKAIGRKMKEYDEESFKKDQLINVLKEQTQKETLDDLLDMSEEQYGVKIQRTRTNKNDEKVLGKHDAKEILEVQDDAFIEKELDRLANLKRTEREEETYSELKANVESKKSEAQKKKIIEENGLDENVINTDEFKDFEKNFSKEAPFLSVYEMYTKLNGIKEDIPYSAGSLKDTKIKQSDEFYSIDEFNALTSKDLDNPKIYEKAMKSLHHFYQ